MNPGVLIVISAPSGSGKTTIAREIMKLFPSLGFSISATTRQRRATEVDGRDYFFLSRMEFERRVAAGEFVEWEEIYGDLYGTLKSEVDRAIKDGKPMVFDVDVKGALSIKQLYPRAVLIFVAPPGLEVLQQRLAGRLTENDTALQKRLARVPMEMEMANKFDHCVVNDDLARAVVEVQEIVESYL